MFSDETQREYGDDKSSKGPARGHFAEPRQEVRFQQNLTGKTQAHIGFVMKFETGQTNFSQILRLTPSSDNASFNRVKQRMQIEDGFSLKKPSSRPSRSGNNWPLVNSCHRLDET